MPTQEAVVVGAGPNGLSAAVAIARAGLSVLVIEGAREIGGGTRTEALTLPGFVHDVCSAVHPMAAASPFFSTLPLAAHGLEWIDPPIALAHPFDGGSPALLTRDVTETASSLGPDGPQYERLVEPIARHWHELAPDLLAPLRWPEHPLRLARFGARGVRSVEALVSRFGAGRGSALLGGVGAHALQPLAAHGTAAFALVLAALAHRSGWPIAKRGSRSITDALAAHLIGLGGQIEVARPIARLRDIPPARAILLDVTPRQVLRMCGDALPQRYARSLAGFRYGPGVFKVDWALSAPVPWTASECHRAGTLHLAGSYDELAANEARVARGEHPQRPTVLVSQPSTFDRSRAPAGRATLWGYCHVPHASTVDMLQPIEAQIERFAPGFRDLVLARHVMNAAQLEARNPNLVGGDIGQGANTLRQLFFRPVARANPYRTPIRGLYLCSASTPPGGAVHGMCGYHAAQTALRDLGALER